jgi:putative ABC transport system permease protein
VGASLLWTELPIPDAGHLVIVRTNPSENPLQNAQASVPDYVAWSENNRTFESMGASLSSQQDLGADEGGPALERIAGQAVTPSLFDTLQVKPELGRVLHQDESQIGYAAPVVILSHRLWQRRFAGDTGIVGRSIRLNGRSLEVIGVMPPGFLYPNGGADFWVPLGFTSFQLQASARLFTVAGRLKSGTTLEQAQADVDQILSERERSLSGRHTDWHARLVPLRQYWYGWITQPLMTLEGAVILVLLIACANVSTLLLARVPSRQSEVTVRRVMGATRGRIVRQFMTESLLLSLIGGALGILVAWWGVRSLEDLQAPPGGISIAGMASSSGVFGLTAMFSIVSSLIFGLFPALVAFSSGTDLKKATVHRRRGHLSSVLVSVQVGLALILLVSSGLLVNSFVRLLLDDRGFVPDGMITFDYRIPVQEYVQSYGSYRGMPAMKALPPTLNVQRVYERLKALPGAEFVAGSSSPPINGLVPPLATLIIEGRPVPESRAEREAANVYYFLITDNFFETMKTPLLRGRDFDASDNRSSPWVAVINETMANRFWPGQDPIGKHFTVDAVSGEQPREVIGVVRDVSVRYIRTGSPQAVAYTLYLQQPEQYEGFNTGAFGQMTFFIRSNGDPSRLGMAARQAVAEVDPDHPLANIRTMEEVVSNVMRTRRYDASVLGVFALMATVLAAVGVYGVISSSVSQRTREIGIHMAMGASSGDIIRLIGTRAFVFVGIGLLFGLFSSVLLTRLLETQLWGITSTDPATFAAGIALLAFVSLAACFFPARRAMSVDPAEALRTD